MVSAMLAEKYSGITSEHLSKYGVFLEYSQKDTKYHLTTMCEEI